MWIFCCGMQRSGSTLQFQITSQLVEEAGLGKRMEWRRPERFGELREKYADDEKWKVFKNHLCTDEMEKEFHRQNAKGIYVFRDLRDVFGSAMRKYSTTFDQLWDSRFLYECLDQYQRWTSLPRVLVSKYEEMVTDLSGEVKRIATHLGISLDQKKYHRIALEHTRERQVQRIEEAIKKGRLRQGFVSGPLFDPHTMLHTNHIHSGEIDGWKNLLTLKQAALIEGTAQEWLLARGYKLTNPKRNRFQRIVSRFR